MPNHRDGKKRFVFKSRIPSEIKRLRGRTDQELIQQVGEIYGRYIVQEIKNQATKAASLGLGVPRSKDFRDSFSFEVNDAGDVVIKSDWPWVKRYLKARGALKMNWLTAANPKLKSRVIPLTQKDGTVAFRSVPLQTKNAWVHPAIDKYTFIERGVSMGIKKAKGEVVRYLSNQGKKRR